MLQAPMAILAGFAVFFGYGLVFRPGGRSLLPTHRDAFYDFGAVALVIGLFGVIGPAIIALFKGLQAWLTGRPPTARGGM
jgi:hypothetical protein